MLGSSIVLLEAHWLTTISGELPCNYRKVGFKVALSAASLFVLSTVPIRPRFSMGILGSRSFFRSPSLFNLPKLPGSYSGFAMYQNIWNVFGTNPGWINKQQENISVHWRSHRTNQFRDDVPWHSLCWDHMHILLAPLTWRKSMEIMLPG